LLRRDVHQHGKCDDGNRLRRAKEEKGETHRPNNIMVEAFYQDAVGGACASTQKRCEKLTSVEYEPDNCVDNCVRYSNIRHLNIGVLVLIHPGSFLSKFRSRSQTFYVAQVAQAKEAKVKIIQRPRSVWSCSVHHFTE